MSDIILSSGVRQNLLSLQNTAALMATTQNRLATGKKVNTALDNPTSFFTSQSPEQSRQRPQLPARLDRPGHPGPESRQYWHYLAHQPGAIRKVDRHAGAAGHGTDRDLQRRDHRQPAIAADTSRSVSTATYASVSGGLTASAKSTFTVDTSGGVGADGGTLTINDNNGHSVHSRKRRHRRWRRCRTFRQHRRGRTVVAIERLRQRQRHGPPGTNIIILAPTIPTPSLPRPARVRPSETAAADGGKLTISQGSTTETFRYVASGASTGAGTFTTLADLTAAINASTVGNSGGPTLASTVLASDAAPAISSSKRSEHPRSRSAARWLRLSATPAPTTPTTTPRLPPCPGTLTVTVGTGATQTITFGTGRRPGPPSTTALAGITGVSASINGSNQIALSSTTSDNITIGGTAIRRQRPVHRQPTLASTPRRSPPAPAARSALDCRPSSTTCSPRSTSSPTTPPTTASTCSMATILRWCSTRTAPAC